MRQNLVYDRSFKKISVVILDKLVNKVYCYFAYTLVGIALSVAHMWSETGPAKKIIFNVNKDLKGIASLPAQN